MRSAILLLLPLATLLAADLKIDHATVAGADLKRLQREIDSGKVASERISGYAYSKDGSRLAVGRGHADSDTVLLRSVSRQQF